MRYGAMLDNSQPLANVIDQVRGQKEAGFTTAWTSQIFGYDALTMLAVIGREVPDIQLGTAVIPTYPRHPLMLAAQALTVQAAVGDRLVLGIGLSHQIVIENMFGYSFDKPGRHMREYLSALMPALRGEQVAFTGETLKANTMGPLDVKGAQPPQVLLAALAPVMLKLAGGVADGTATWMTGPDTVANHIVPSITKAAEEAGRPAPRIVVGLPISLTADADAARQQAATTFAIYGQLPSYRAMLDKEGAGGPADVAIVGDESVLTKELQRLAESGATDFCAAVFGSSEDQRRTSEFLAAQASA